MGDAPSNNKPNGVSGVDTSNDASELERLRRLLIGPEQDEVKQLHKRLEDPKIRAQDISGVLPEAIVLRSSQDKQIAKALEPITEASIKASIKKNRNILIEALSPVMGPAIRKAIASTIRAMIQSFNQVLEHSFSIQGFKWRIEALRTRKPFGEVVLLHTLVYQVEQVFLVHRETGLVLQHVVAKEVAVQDPDLVSSMLTAIQDFVRDSFGTGRGGTLDTLQVGDRSVWIEQGPKAFLAAVVRGTPPQDLKGDLREAIDTIHLEQEENLESFDGDTIPFEAVRYRLEECLQSQAKEPERKSSPILWVTLLLVLFLLGAWIVHSIKSYTGWKDYLAGLHKEPGIVVTNHEKHSGKYHIFGLKDPFATDPMKLLLEAELDPERFVFHWEPYHSFHWAFTLKRSKQLLRPPESVTLGFQNGILYAKGAALDPWIKKTKNLAPTLPGVVYFNGDGIVNINQVMDPPETIHLTLNQGILSAQGEASHEWILGARNQSREIPGIVEYRDHDVVDSDLNELEQLKKRLEKHAILFRHGSSKIMPDQKKILESVSEELKRFIHLAATLGIHPLIKILGHTDSTGPEKTNLGLSLKRAERIHAFLVSKGFHENAFSTVGLAATDPLTEEESERDRARNRRADFKIILPAK